MQAGWPGCFASKVRPDSTSSAPLLHECICTEQRHLKKYRAFSLFHVFLGLKGKLGVYERAKPVDSSLSQMSRRSGLVLLWYPRTGLRPWAGRAAPCLSLQVHSWLGSSEGTETTYSHCLSPNASPSQKARVYFTSGLRSSEVALLLWDSRFIKRCGEGVDEAGCWLASTTPTSPLTRFCRAGALLWTVRFPWDPVCFYF